MKEGRKERMVTSPGSGVGPADGMSGAPAHASSLSLVYLLWTSFPLLMQISSMQNVLADLSGCGSGGFEGLGWS